MKIDDLFCIEPKIVNLSLGFKHFFTAILILVWKPSFRHRLPESSAMDGNLSVHKCLIKHDWQILVSRPCDWIPASRQE